MIQHARDIEPVIPETTCASIMIGGGGAIIDMCSVASLLVESSLKTMQCRSLF